MPEESPLEQFQDALIGLLASGQPQRVILETLKSDPRFDIFRNYVDEFDPDMVAIACELMGKWSKLRATDGETE